MKQTPVMQGDTVTRPPPVVEYSLESGGGEVILRANGFFVASIKSDGSMVVYGHLPEDLFDTVSGGYIRTRHG